MREILVITDKRFIVTVPDYAALTFGPWSPPKEKNSHPYDQEGKRGTLRIYSGKAVAANILAVFSGVVSFRDMSIGYREEVAREEGATIWKDDEEGYVRDTKVSRKKQWVVPQLKGGEV